MATAWFSPTSPEGSLLSLLPRFTGSSHPGVWAQLSSGSGVSSEQARGPHSEQNHPRGGVWDGETPQVHRDRELECPG